MDTSRPTNPGPRSSPWRSPARSIPPAGPVRYPVALRALKAVHTLVWISVESAMVYLLYSGIARRSDRRAAVAGAVVAGETLIFLGNGARCPLTDLAVPLGGTRVPVTDIYLPRWFAHNLPAIHAPLLLAAVLLHSRNLRHQREDRATLRAAASHPGRMTRNADA